MDGVFGLALCTWTPMNRTAVYSTLAFPVLVLSLVQLRYCPDSDSVFVAVARRSDSLALQLVQLPDGGIVPVLGVALAVVLRVLIALSL